MKLIPAMEDLHTDLHPFVVLQKAAQIGGSEWLVSTALWFADTGQGDRGNVLYVMPTERDMRDLDTTRLNRAIVESHDLAVRVRKSARDGADRLGLVAFPKGYIFKRGSDSDRQLTSVDADLVILDEYELMRPGVLPLAMQRLGSSKVAMMRVASTPREPESGINELFLQSDQRHYLLPCLSCGSEQFLSWPENIDFKRELLVCGRSSCRAPLDVWARGRWVAEAPDNTAIHGYQLSRLYSPLANIRAIIAESRLTSLSDEQRFYNQVLGEVYKPSDSGLSADDLDRCCLTYSMSDYTGGSCVMGVDVGKTLHVVVRQHARGSSSVPGRLWYVGEVDGFHSLDELMTRFDVSFCVVDSQPEGHAALEFASRFHYRVALASYSRHQPGHDYVKGRLQQRRRGPNLFHINRTEALDELIAYAKEGKLPLPRDARQLGGDVRDGRGSYYRHLLAEYRTVEVSHDENWASRWHSASRPDHYLHAEVYAMVANAAPILGRPGRVVGFNF